MYAITEWRVVRTSGANYQHFMFALLMGEFCSVTNRRTIHAFRLSHSPTAETINGLSKVVETALSLPVLDYIELKAQYDELERRPQGEGLAVEFNPHGP